MERNGVGAAAARLLSLSMALNDALRHGQAEFVVMLAEEKQRAVDVWIKEKRAENPRCFDLPTPLEKALLEVVQ